jgi:hypothetical protein
VQQSAAVKDQALLVTSRPSGEGKVDAIFVARAPGVTSSGPAGTGTPGPAAPARRCAPAGEGGGRQRAQSTPDGAGGVRLPRSAAHGSSRPRLIEDAARVSEEGLIGRRQLDSPVGPVEQRGSVARLEMTNGLREPGLGHVQLVAWSGRRPAPWSPRWRTPRLGWVLHQPTGAEVCRRRPSRTCPAGLTNAPVDHRLTTIVPGSGQFAVIRQSPVWPLSCGNALRRTSTDALRTSGGQGVAGSNPVNPTVGNRRSGAVSGVILNGPCLLSEGV